MHFDKLTHLQVGILQASPIYNENLYSLSVHTSFVNSAKAYLVHMVAVRSGARPGASPTIEQPNYESNALVRASMTIDGQSSCFL